VSRRYSIRLVPTAFECLAEIKDRKTRSEIARAIDALASNPDEQGKPLMGPLEGLRSVRAARSRYRVIYKVETPGRVVTVLFAGRRRPGERADVYEVAERLLDTMLRGRR
jgi:mRNA interferase RelE/StbE